MQDKENFPFINKSQIKVILSQLEKCTCKIIKDIGNNGTGFFCKIPYPDQFHLLPVLITNNHVLNEDNLKIYSNIRFTINDDNIEKNIVINDSRLVFTDKEIDITIIEIKPFDKINHFLDIDEDILTEKNYNNSYKNEQIYILQYPNGKKASYSVGRVKNISDFDIDYYCYTDFGSSGSPILLLSKLKLIGVHKKKTQFNFNRGTLIKAAIDKLNSQKPILAELTKKKDNPNFEKKEYQLVQDYVNGEINNTKFVSLMNCLYSPDYIDNSHIEYKNIIEMILRNHEDAKDIYFLDNTSYIDENGFKHYHDGLKELNESNVQLYINDLEIKFTKHFIFSRANFKIKMIIKTKMTNCKNMFNDCANLIKIDLSSFDTSNVTNMSGMFKGCGNLKNLNLSSLNTENVTDMSYMFRGCYLLENIDLSSFNTKNVTNMKEMFSHSFGFLYNPITLNLSSFDTRKVTDMEKMFYNCKTLKNIIFSPSFNTINVTNMCNMFDNCLKLENLNLSSFDTRNVVNMKEMFQHCDNLETLDLSSFNTENVTNMMSMFFCCDKLISLDLSNFNTKKVIDMRWMFQSCRNLKNLNLSSFSVKSITKIEGMFDFCINLNNVIFNNTEDSNLIKNLYNAEHSSISMLDFLPSEFFISNINPNSVPLMLFPGPMPNFLLPVQAPAHTTEKFPVHTNPPINQVTPDEGNPTQIVGNLPQRIVRNELVPRYHNLEHHSKVVQEGHAPTFSSPTPQLSPPSIPKSFSTENIFVPQVRAIKVANEPVTAPTQAIYAQAPIDNHQKIPTFATTSAGKNIPFGASPSAMTIPYGNDFAPISTNTNDKTPFKSPKSTNDSSPSIVRNPGLLNTKVVPIY